MVCRAPCPTSRCSWGLGGGGSTGLLKYFTFQNFLLDLSVSVSWCTHFFQALGRQRSQNCFFLVETTKPKCQTVTIWQDGFQMYSLKTL